MPDSENGGLKRKRSFTGTTCCDTDAFEAPSTDMTTHIKQEEALVSAALLHSPSSLASSKHTPLPELPVITGDIILETYTHKSLRFKGAYHSDQPADNERLSELGDMAVKLAVTNALYHRKPVIEAMDIPSERDAILSNENLQNWVTQYGLRQRLRYLPPIDITAPEETRSLFNAYVGAVYTQLGMRVVGTWISGLIDPANLPVNPDGMVPLPVQPGGQKSSKQRETKRIKETPSNNATLDNVHGNLPPSDVPQPPLPSNAAGLPPVLTSSAGYSAPLMTFPQSSPSPINGAYYAAQSPAQPTGAATPQYLQMFNQKCAQMKLTVKYTDENQGLPHAPRWVIKCMVNGVVKGQGQGTSKQIAKEEAAKLAYYSMGWMAYNVNL